MKMIKASVGVAVVLSVVAAIIGDQAGGAAESVAAQQIDRASTRRPVSAAADTFTGNARVERLFAATKELPVAGAYVTFESGARSNWHTHPAGQRLVVIAGAGRTQEWGKPMQEIHPGDVIVCPPGVKHWHGASPSNSMTHLAVTGNVGGKTVNWMERVTEDQYAGK
jgi:quercetin dioxygenase-like cupin family protein